MSNSVRPHRRRPTRLLFPGFSRQEYWCGLPFPSPVHESEKWKWSRSIVCNSSPPHGLQPTRLLHPWDFPGKSTGVGCHCLLRLLFNILVDSLPAEPPQSKNALKGQVAADTFKTVPWWLPFREEHWIFWKLDRETGTVLVECKMAQLLWTPVCRFLKKIKK